MTDVLTPSAVVVASAPSDVRDYCERRRLFDPLELAINLVHSTFPAKHRMALTLETDPELGEQSVVIRVEVAGSQEKILEARSRLIEAWVKQVPQEALEHLRLSVRVL
jgi:hypothetical protein